MMGMFDIDLDKLVPVELLRRGIDNFLTEEDFSDKFTTRDILNILKYDIDNFVSYYAACMLEGKMDNGILVITKIVKERNWLNPNDKSEYNWSFSYTYTSFSGIMTGGKLEIKDFKQKIRQSRLEQLGI